MQNPTYPNIDRTGRWTEDEGDNKLKDSVERHGGEDWVAIAVLVPGRTSLEMA